MVDNTVVGVFLNGPPAQLHGACRVDFEYLSPLEINGPLRLLLEECVLFCFSFRKRKGRLVFFPIHLSEGVEDEPQGGPAGWRLSDCRYISKAKAHTKNEIRGATLSLSL